MKFAHIADCHLGGWREPKMREINAAAFEMAIDRVIDERVEFLLIAGDLFNTAVPPIDSLKLVVRKLQQVRAADIPVYCIAGSHDYSPSGKTMLDVLEHAGLIVDVARGEETQDNQLRLKFTQDRSGTKITGLVGRRGGLETSYYENLEREHLENEPGSKIFMFHSAITELKPKHLAEMESMPTSLLPKNFDYYAGGHVHITDNAQVAGYKNIVYPGPTYPNNFSELEKLQHGSFVLVVDGKIEHVPLEPKKTRHIVVDAQHKMPADVEECVLNELADMNDRIVTIRVFGELKEGRPSDIDWQRIIAVAYERGAFFVMKNANRLSSKAVQQITVSEDSIDDVEATLLREHGQDEVASDLMQVLSVEKKEGEKAADFEKRIVSEVDALLL